MGIEVGSAGKLGFGVQQQRWHAGNEGDGAVMQIARFAGQEMMAIPDDQGCFDLHYLGFDWKGFKSMNEAKAAAPAFARQVLARMSALIAD